MDPAASFCNDAVLSAPQIDDDDEVFFGPVTDIEVQRAISINSITSSTTETTAGVTDPVVETVSIPCADNTQAFGATAISEVDSDGEIFFGEVTAAEARVHHIVTERADVDADKQNQIPVRVRMGMLSNNQNTCARSEKLDLRYVDATI